MGGGCHFENFYYINLYFEELWTFKVKAHFLLTLFIYFINLIYSFLNEYFILKF